MINDIELLSSVVLIGCKHFIKVLQLSVKGKADEKGVGYSIANILVKLPINKSGTS